MLSYDLLHNTTYRIISDKISVGAQGIIRLTDDNSLETASEVMQMLNMDQRLPNGRESYLKLLQDLNFRSNQDGGD